MIYIDLLIIIKKRLLISNNAIFYEQVVLECSEAAKVAISVKQSYQYLLAPISKKHGVTDEVFERYIESFNTDLKSVLEVWLHYMITYTMVCYWDMITLHDYIHYGVSLRCNYIHFGMFLWYG